MSCRGYVYPVVKLIKKVPCIFTLYVCCVYLVIKSYKLLISCCMCKVNITCLTRYYESHKLFCYPQIYTAVGNTTYDVLNSWLTCAKAHRCVLKETRTSNEPLLKGTLRNASRSYTRSDVFSVVLNSPAKCMSALMQCATRYEIHIQDVPGGMCQTSGECSLY